MLEVSCNICGLILAHEGSDLPSWCKVIRGLCWVADRPILSGLGSVDGHLHPFNLEVPQHGPRRFHNRRKPGPNTDLCYPFHDACWNLLLETDSLGVLKDNIDILFNIFHSIPARHGVPRWGHDYFLNEILPFHEQNEEDLTIQHRYEESVLSDPLEFVFNFDQFLSSGKRSQKRLELRSINSDLNARSTCFDKLPREVYQHIICCLDFCDVQSLHRAIGSSLWLQTTQVFWESTFWPDGEFGFASSLLPLSISWKERFCIVYMELQREQNMASLRNRKRIWKITSVLIRIVYAMRHSEWKCHGALATKSMDNICYPAASCLASEDDLEGCRELKQVFVRLDGAIRALNLSRIAIYDRYVVSGLQFLLIDGTIVDTGYISGLRTKCIHKTGQLERLWLVCTPFGFEHISTEYPKSFLESTPQNNALGVIEFRINEVAGIYLGLDAMRVVRVCPVVRQHDPVRNILWKHPYPSLNPSFHATDIKSITAFQKRSFAPASFHAIDDRSERLLAIKVYHPLGYYAGITGVGFVYNNQRETTWGAVNDAASAVFFLREAEHITKVIVLCRGSLASHLLFVTNQGRESQPLPSLPLRPGLNFDCNEFSVPDGDSIQGLCAVFKTELRELHCLGVLSKSGTTSSKSVWETTACRLICEHNMMSLGGIRHHGQTQTSIDLSQNYQAIQASVTPVETKYRRKGQVTGLLFYSYENKIPHLLGQFTGLGERYDLRENENVLGLYVSTTSPIPKLLPRTGLYQVQTLSLATNERELLWGLSLGDDQFCRRNFRGGTVVWEFNAIYDRLIYP